MSIIIHLLIFFYIKLNIYQIFLAYFNVKEGLDNPSGSNATTNVVVLDNKTPENDPMILSQKNSGNIDLLKNRVDDMEKKQTTIMTGDIPTINNHLKELDTNYKTLNTKMDNLIETQAKYASAISKPPEITGAI